MPATPKYDYQGARGLDFNYTLWGSPNLAGMMKGAKGRFLPRIDPFGRDNLFDTLDMDESIVSIGAHYQGRIETKFAERHGRTGETVNSVYDTLEGGAKGGYAGDVTYRIEWHGGVGFVINPLPSHTLRFIPGGAPAGPFEGRTTNFYSPAVGARREFDWYQGGEESYSPDTSWFDEDSELIADARAALARMGARAQLVWGAQGGQLIPLSYPRTNPEPYVGPWS